jgi:hypothetical protein
MKKLMVFFLAIVIGISFGFTVPQASAHYKSGVQVADGGIGDVLLFSLYDVRAKTQLEPSVVPDRDATWENYIAIENTSGLWTAFHLRFRSWKKSIEVYDHVILLSPYDVFWLTLARASGDGVTTDFLSDGSLGTYSEGDVVISSSDTHTLWNSGLIYENLGQTVWKTTFQPFLLDDCGYPDGGAGIPTDIKEEMQTGHVEIIGLWQLWPAGYEGAVYEDTHNIKDIVTDIYKDGTSLAGKPTINIFDLLDGLFYEYNGSTHIGPGWPDLVTLHNGEVPKGSTARDGKDCGNVLTGIMSFGDPMTGRYQLENWIALENFRTDLGDSWSTEYYSSEPVWLHRDGYSGGGIYFPTSVARWFYGYGNPVTSYTGGTYDTYLWYYVNESWTNTVGPGLRDGDDLKGKNWNDVNTFDETLVDSYGSTSDYFDADAQVHYFNDIWSLDDVEAALAKSEIWYTHFRTRPTNPNKPSINTYVVLTYPTKHYHWFFADWPFMWKENGSLTQTDVDDYWRNLDNYRGSDVESSKNSKHLSIADWFYDEWKNGLVAVTSRIWDMEQNAPGYAPGTPPPGSPYRPGIILSKYVPHETNIINVGEEEDLTGIGLGDANYLLAAANANDSYGIGHFVLSTSYLKNGERGLGFKDLEACTFGTGEVLPATCVNVPSHGIYNSVNNDWYGTGYPIPVIGLVSYLHAYASQGLITRSNMAEWHYHSEELNLIYKGLD